MINSIFNNHFSRTLLQNVKVFFKVLLNILILLISFIVYKEERIWIFGSWFGEQFLDNTKYLFLYCDKYKQELALKKVIWITNNNDVYKELKFQGFEVYKKWSIKSLWYHLRAKKHFICQVPDDINPWFSVRADRIQLWHGVGFKKLTDIKIIDKKNIRNKIMSFLNLISSKGFWYRYTFLSTSEFATENIFKYSFRLWENSYFESNYPRNIYLNNLKIEDYYIDIKQRNLIEYIKKKKKNNSLSVILYVPTYRSTDRKNRYPLNVSSEEKFKDLLVYLESNEILFLNKSHFIEKVDAISQEYFIDVDSTLDIYPILRHIDILITDYSSIYSDFLFMNKPIIFYAYDLEYYNVKDKGFLFEYEDVVTGDIVFDIEELKESIIKNLNCDEYSVKREELKKLYFGRNSEDTMLDFINKIKSIN